MTAHQAEAIILRTWPMHEADQIVSLFTRDQGKIKGVAKAAMNPVAALEAHLSR